MVFYNPDEKFAPEVSSVRDFTPYFSWTMKSKPSVEILDFGRRNPPPLVWQQYFTPKDYEEWNTTSGFHLGSLHLLGRSEGNKGSIRLLDQNGTGVQKWDFNILDKDSEDLVGLSYQQIKNYHVFTCISASEDAPMILKFKPLVSDERDYPIQRINSVSIYDTIERRFFLYLMKLQTQVYVVTECPEKPEEDDVGCAILTTHVPQGEVTCIGEGVNKTIRYPIGFSGTSKQTISCRLRVN